jgi:hypothetical protein
MKVVSALMSALVALQFAAPQMVSAEGIRFSASGDSAGIEGTAKLKSISSLHMDNGAAVFKQHHVAILADASDSLTEAELTGRTFDLHLTGSESQPVISGLALFFKGPSISALDDATAEDTITLRDGTSTSGRIVDVNDETVHLKDGVRLKTVSTKNIASVKSPRCFAFTLPVAPTPTSSATTPQPVAETSMVTFRSNYVQPPVSVATLLPTTAMLEGQLTQHSIGKKLFVYSLGAAAFCTCFTLPIILAITTPKQLSSIKDAVRTVKRNKDSGTLK